MERDPSFFTQHRGIREGQGLPNSHETLLRNWRGAVEFDVYQLKDGTMAVLHQGDYGLSMEDIENMSLADLEKMVIPADSPASEGKAIPLLKEYLGLAVDANARLVLELKGSTVEKQIAIAAESMKELRIINRGSNDYLEKKVLIQSFSSGALDGVQHLADQEQLQLQLGLYWPGSKEWAKKTPGFDWHAVEDITEWDQRDWQEVGIEVAARRKLQTVGLMADVVTEQLVTLAHAKGLKVSVAVIRDPESADTMKQMGVDEIVTEL